MVEESLYKKFGYNLILGEKFRFKLYLVGLNCYSIIKNIVMIYDVLLIYDNLVMIYFLLYIVKGNFFW